MVNTDRLCMGCMNDNGGEQICPICGYDNSGNNPAQYLAVGTWLNANRYNVGKVVEETGDGVTYIGWDNDNNAVVNIKEYFPAGIAVRSNDRLTVTPDEEKGLAFNKGREEFVKLFSALSNVNESVSILRVTDLFESGGTVYAVLSTVSGTTLKAFLLRNGGSLKWEQVKPLFMPLISTVFQLNDAGIYHRGICPDSIIVGRDGKLRLTGFCIPSVRKAHSEFLSQLPSGYMAPEQYLENAENCECCDVYALGAVLFRTLIGTTPPDAKDRLVNDKLAIPTKITETVPRGALVAIANALKVDPAERIGSADRLYKMFEAVATNTVVISDNKPAEEPKVKKGSGAKYAIISVLITSLVFVLAILAAIYLFDFGKKPTPSEPTNNSSTFKPSDITSSASSGYAPGTVLFEVPNLVGEKYTEVYGDIQTEYSHFQFVVAGRVASETIPRGAICQQSVEKGTKVERDTVIELYISQGSDKVSLPSIIGKTIIEGKNALFDAGFYSDTVIVRKGFDLDAEPGEIYRVASAKDDSTIRSGSQVSINELIVVYYRDPDTAEPSEEASSNDNSSKNNSSNVSSITSSASTESTSSQVESTVSTLSEETTSQ